MSPMKVSALCLLLLAGSVQADSALIKMHHSMDVNQDDVVSEAEFLDYWGQHFERTDSNGDQSLSLSEAGSGLLKSTDANQDGVSTLSEYRELRQRHFDLMDKDDSESLTLAELQRQSNAGKRSTVATSAGSSTDFSEQLAQVTALSDLTEAPVMHLAQGFDSTDDLVAIFYEALDWKGQPTKVFAWLGVPAECDEKVPAVVLVHGGGGTAFKQWVEKWNARGYAAISIAVEGQTDVKGASGDRHAPWTQHQWPGPKRSGIYGDSSAELQDQWMYHAVADAILANSLLRSLEQVDADRVGIMGISWGGVITSTVIGIDDRFAFAIPVYGCGNLSTAENQYGRSLGTNETYKQVWDPILRLGRASMPTLWSSWPGDSHFPLDLQASCYEVQPGPRMVSLVPKMGHGHGSSWNRPESYAFADSVLNDGGPWCVQKSARTAGDQYSVVFQSSQVLDAAELVSTTDSGVTGSRTWVQTPLSNPSKKGDRWSVRAKIPEGSTAWFINVKSGNLVSSSDFVAR